MDSTQVKNLYLNDHLSCLQIAKIAGVSKQAIWEKIHKMGISRGNKKSDKFLEKNAPYCKCGCRKKVVLRLCRRWPLYIEGHRSKKFDELYTINTKTGCWEWNGTRIPKGYGMWHLSGKRIYAHRHSWEKFYQSKIPKGLQIDHLCRNKSCCNPTHLEAVTCKENIRRSKEMTT